MKKQTFSHHSLQKLLKAFICHLPSQEKNTRLLARDGKRSQLNTEQRELCNVAYVIVVLSTRP